MPFVQGQLRNEKIDFHITSACAYSGRTIEIDMTSDLEIKNITDGADPYLFIPNVDMAVMSAPSIIEVF